MKMIYSNKYVLRGYIESEIFSSTSHKTKNNRRAQIKFKFVIITSETIWKLSKIVAIFLHFVPLQKQPPEVLYKKSCS